MKTLGMWCLIAVLFSAAALAGDRHLDSFDRVWQTVDQSHYDPTFGGVDWPGQRERYRTLAAAAGSLSEFCRTTNRLLFELKLSHLLVASTQDLQRYLPTVMAPGTIGATLRLLEGQCVIAAVDSGSPAQQADLHPGFVLSAIDDRPIAKMIEAALQDLMPPYNRRNRENIVTRYLMGQIQGPPGTIVRLAGVGENGRPFACSISRASTGTGVRLVEFLPPYHLRFEYRRLEPRIGYVRFNHFAPPIDRQLAEVMATLPERDALVIDLRGTPGGYLRSLDTVAGMLVAPPVVLYRLQLRDRIVDRMPVAAARVHAGPVAVLVDALSLSASEILAGCLQQIGRARIVGNRTPGYVLAADWIELPNGALLMHTIGRNVMPDGTILENTGVIPDIEAVLEPGALLEGRDTQIEAAVNALRAALDRPAS